jgi:hypothetical protein
MTSDMCTPPQIDESGGLAGMATRTTMINGKERSYMDNIRWAGAAAAGCYWC